MFSLREQGAKTKGWMLLQNIWNKNKTLIWS